MGLDVTSARKILERIRLEQFDESVNNVVLERNSVVLTDVTLNQDYDKVTTDLRFTPGMVRFIYVDLNNITRSIEGYVCLVEYKSLWKVVKIWTEKNEMVSIKLYCESGVTVVQLPSSYTSLTDNHQF